MRFRVLGLIVLVLLSGCFVFANEVDAGAVSNSKGYISYKVRSGDSLWALGHKFGVSVKQLKALNNLKSDKLAINQVLKIPTQTKKSTVSVSRQPQASRGSSMYSKHGELVSWEKADNLFPRGKKAVVFDLASGKSFQIVRNEGHYHADCDPLTADDTAVLRSIFGNWSWDRRAILVKIGSRSIAASMNGMPHGDKYVKNNNFPGHFCIHFLGSKTHGSSYTKSGVPKVDPAHQAMVRKAAGV